MSGDAEKLRYLQKTLGYGLTANTRFECMFFYYGETTRNGKGTLVESVLAVMGDYGITVRPETIMQKTINNSHAPSEDIARLTNIRFANISEPDKSLRLSGGQLKNMTGNDTLNARFLNADLVRFRKAGLNRNNALTGVSFISTRFGSKNYYLDGNVTMPLRAFLSFLRLPCKNGLY